MEHNKITKYFITEDNPTTPLDTIPTANRKEINTNDKDFGKHTKSINYQSIVVNHASIKQIQTITGRLTETLDKNINRNNNK